MATKKDELSMLALGQGCLGKAADDEPIFILRAQDISAPLIVRLWADLASKVGCDQAKVDEATDLASNMEQWQIDNTCKWPD